MTGPHGVDRVLEALRATGPDAYRADVRNAHTWWAYCPACDSRRFDDRRLVLREHGGHVVATCAHGCSEIQIARALREAERGFPATWGDDPEHPSPDLAARLAEHLLAEAKLRRERRGGLAA